MTAILHAQGLASGNGTRWFDLQDSVTGTIRRVLLWVPPAEMPLAPFQIGAKDEAKRSAENINSRTIAAAQEMAAQLAKLPGLTARYETYPGENHMSVLPVAVNRALQVVFARR